ncbi:MAG: acetamidase/formamidase family protein [Tuberibacillus sp.]
MSVVVKLGKPIYAFSSEHEPVAHVNPGEEIVVETYDCFENQIRSEDTEINSIDWNRINPATGPIFVNGAEPGDALAVHIHKIDISSEGVMSTGKDLGVMGHRLEGFAVKMIPVENEHAVFNDKLKIPLNKMIGVIGVAPESDPVSCGTPGRHGGNMDTTLITEGATVYFPVFHEGALFGLGDMHAAMGDGEVGVSGIEIDGQVTLTFEVIKNAHLKHPMIKNNDGFGIIVSDETLDQAAKSAVEELIDFLSSRINMELSELTMLMSAIGQLQISQVVDPKLTARFIVPQWFLDAYDIQPF